ncbi:xylosyltransferase oxt, partial [Eurytemora carolleeae]|uniref:xylosyltransferase oxt n=1 Tax=Eurytemora carolleeae TaxID=1294199 RepID=UPI000C78254C
PNFTPLTLILFYCFSECPVVRDNSILLRGGTRVGCFKDLSSSRLLRGAEIKRWSENSVESCVLRCNSSGFRYAGVEYGNECFCGDTILDPETSFPVHRSNITSLQIKDSNCNMKCPSQTANRFCGGFNALELYLSGVISPKPEPPPALQARQQSSVRIVFLLTLSGRSLRQIKRLLRLIYKPHHFYFIHVDENSQWLFNNLIYLESMKNIRLTRNRFSPFWASNTLLFLLLACFEEILSLSWNWDYIMNISESDLPVKPIQQFENHLRKNIGKNFVAFDPHNQAKFLRSHGLHKIFYNCDQHMYRIGERSVPTGLRWMGGSDWIILHREFLIYLIYSDSSLIRSLNSIYFYSVMAPESYFHTVLFNSRFCSTIQNDNFRFVHWNKSEESCSCSRSMDWCGCSPLVLRVPDIPHLKSRIQQHNVFFARKFDSFIDQSPVNWIAEKLEGRLVSETSVGWDYYWTNIYQNEDTSTFLAGSEEIYVFLVNTFIQDKSEFGDFKQILEINLVIKENETIGDLLLFSTSSGKFEILTRFDPGLVLLPDGLLKSSFNSLTIQVGSEYDRKEKMLRDKSGIFFRSRLPVLILDLQLKEEKLVDSIQLRIFGSQDEMFGSKDLIPISSSRLIALQLDSFLQKNITGLMRLEVWEQESLLATIQFIIFDEELNIPRTVLLEMFPFLDYCSISLNSFTNNSSHSKRSLVSSSGSATSSLTSSGSTTSSVTAQCSETSWSSRSPDPKSDFPV